MTQTITMNIYGKRAFKMFEALYANFRNPCCGYGQTDKYGMVYDVRYSVNMFSEPVMLDDGCVAVRIDDNVSQWAYKCYKNKCPILDKPAELVRNWFADRIAHHAEGGRIRDVKYFPAYAGAEISLVVDALKGASAAELKSRYPAFASKYMTAVDPVDAEVAGLLREEYAKIDKWAEERNRETRRAFDRKRAEMLKEINAERKAAHLALLREVTAKKRAVRKSLNFK